MTTNYAKVKVLKQALHLLQTSGWVQGTYGNPLNGFCAQGACMYAARQLYPSGYTQGSWEAASELSRTTRTGTFYQSILNWNDAPSRTKEEVFALFEQTISRLESK